MKNGQKVTFRGEADETPGILPGDVIFVIQVTIVDSVLSCYSNKFGVRVRLFEIRV